MILQGKDEAFVTNFELRLIHSAVLTVVKKKLCHLIGEGGGVVCLFLLFNWSRKTLNI